MIDKRGVAFVLGLSAVASAGCKTAMELRIDNVGTSTADVSANCGDAMYRKELKPKGRAEWSPTANSCSIGVHGPAEGRELEIRHTCRDPHGCAVTVDAATGAPAIDTRTSGIIYVHSDAVVMDPADAAPATAPEQPDEPQQPIEPEP